MPPDPAPISAAPAPPAPAPSTNTPANAMPPTHVQRRTLGVPQRMIQRAPSRANAPVPTVAASPLPTSAASATVPAPTTAAGLRPPEPTAAVGITEPAPSAATEVPDAAAAEPEPEKITASEESRRIARINRAAQKLEGDRRAFAAERAAAAQATARIAVLEGHFRSAGAAAKADPLGFLQSTFGVAPQAVLDRIIAEGAKPEATRAQEAGAQQAAALQKKFDELQAEMQRSARENAQQKAARETDEYKRYAIAPTLAQADKYPLTMRALGANAVNEVFALQEARYKVTQAEVAAGRRDKPVLLTPSQAADMIEHHYRSQRDLLTGANVAPGKPAASTRIDPAKAKAGSQTQSTGGYEPPQRSFTIRSKR